MLMTIRHYADSAMSNTHKYAFCIMRLPAERQLTYNRQYAILP